MELTSCGFQKIGEWSLKEGRLKSKITFDLDIFENERVIYAFVVKGMCMYIGICDKMGTTLKDRLKRYKYWQGAGTNKRVAQNIRKSLEENKKVEIFALKPQTNLSYNKLLTIDLVRGLEYPLIKKLRPPWNSSK